MSDMVYIQDDFGNRIPMLDGYGNLSVQVVMLYTEDKLSETDRKTVSDFAAADEMANDALAGFALTSNAPKTRYHLGQLNNDIQKRTGAAAVNALPRQQSGFNYRKLAAAIAVLVAVGGATFLGAHYFKKDKLVDDVRTHTVEERAPEREMVKALEVDTEDEAAVQDNVETESVAVAPSTPAPKAVSETKPETTKQAETQVAEKEKVPVKAKDIRTEEDAPAPSALATKTFPSDEKKETPKGETGVEKEKQADGMPKDASLAKVAAEPELAVEQQQKESTANQRVRMTLEALEPQARSAEQKREQATSETADEETASSNEPRAAKYPGGDIAMYKFIERKKIYTEAMRALDMKGVVTVTFDIETDGRVANAKVKSGEHGLMNEDALRVVRSMPKWNAAKNADGALVPSSKTVVIRYGD